MIVDIFSCSVCQGLVFFDNDLCLHCGTTLGYDPATHALVAVWSMPNGMLTRADGTPGEFRYCRNQMLANCNWLVPAEDPSALCASCRLTSVRPDDDDGSALAAFADAEGAKRRLIVQLTELGLPIISRADDPEFGLTFEFLSSRNRRVTTGHEEGTITLDLSESDDAHRAFVAQQLGEPYRTVLGHLRHEIGHYYWPVLVVQNGRLDEFRELFGDERVSYEDSISGHYDDDGSIKPSDVDWSSTHVSQYATMHPWEDWAETFAHYLHIHAGLSAARDYGLRVDEPSRGAGLAAASSSPSSATDEPIGAWLGLSLALNGMARAIGQPDLYPFVLSPRVVAKLDFIHRAIVSGA